MAIRVSSSQRSSRSLCNPWKSSPERYSRAATPVKRDAIGRLEVQTDLAQQRPVVGAQPRAEPALADVVVVAQHLHLLPRRGFVQLGELALGVGHEALDHVDP